MKQAAAAILAFLMVLASLTLASGESFLALATLYAYALFLLFFGKQDVSRWFLVGSTVGMELLGTSRFGLASLLAVLILMIAAVFGERLRFTSAYVRYIVGLAIMLATYAILLFPPATLTARLAELGVAYPVLAASAYGLVRMAPREAHEFV